jgi:hypothetical protein
VKNGSEQCDKTDGVADHYECTDSCTLQYDPYCGDGRINQSLEVCDDNTRDCVISGYKGTQNCDNTCGGWNLCQAVESCGDGVVNGNEKCDGGDNCNPNCTLKTTDVEPVCGNGTIESGEDCDNGTASNGIICTAGYGKTCNYCSRTCANVTVDGPYCGDGVVNGNEQCDSTDNCTEQCTYVPAQSCPTVCGLDVSQVPDGNGGSFQCKATEVCSGSNGNGLSAGTATAGHGGDYINHPASGGAGGGRVLGASTERLSLDDILAEIGQIRAAIASIAAQVAAMKGAVLGAATEVSTGVFGF